MEVNKIKSIIYSLEKEFNHGEEHLVEYIYMHMVAHKHINILNNSSNISVILLLPRQALF